MENLNKIKNDIDLFCDTYFYSEKIDRQKIYDLIIKDYSYQKELGFDNYDGIVALIIYRVCHTMVDNANIYDLFFKIQNESRIKSSSYISPFAVLNCPIALVGKNIEISKGFKLDKNIVLYDNVKLIDKDYGLFDKKSTHIGKDTVINNNSKIYNGADIGEGCVIGDNCIIKEKISANYEVSVISELQIKKSKTSSFISSQELNIFGVVPKYKNTLVVFGEGFYNPKIKLIVDGRSVNVEISYWDKNKIMIKVPYFTVGNCLKNMLIIFSNSQRIVLNNSYGVQKVLKNLKN